MATAGLPDRVDRAETLETFRDRWFTISEHMLDLVGMSSDSGQLAQRIWDTYCYGGVRLYADALDVLNTLRDRGKRLGLVSNWSPSLVCTLERLGIAGHFDAIAISSMVGFRKPDARLFRVALDALAVDPAECAYVGDSVELDVIGASAAGISPILIQRSEAASGSPSSLDASIPDVQMIRTLSDLLCIA